MSKGRSDSMVNGFSEATEFDLKLAIECATAYSAATRLGCTISTADGRVLHETGYGYDRCEICSAVGRDKEECIQTHTYCMTVAERSGGKYIYFCPMGFTCFVSPIVSQLGSTAKITVGPFCMVDIDDYIACDLQVNLGIPDQTIETLKPLLDNIPHVSSSKVNSLSILLFMAVSFMNNVSAAKNMLDSQSSEYIQGQISEYILELKGGEVLTQYPLEIEREMIASIVDSDRQKAQKLLNELLGHILFFFGGDFARIKTRIYELIVMISRAAVDAGVSPDYAFDLTHEFFTTSQDVKNIDSLCLMLTTVMNKFISSIFTFSDVKNVDVIYKALQYMRRNYNQKITLESVAQTVNLSPSYFSKVFKKEVGCNFKTYMNMLRVEKSKKLLLYDNWKLVDIAAAVGFEDQSYFTRVFKHITGMSPNHYRKSGGRRQGDK